MFTHVSQTSKYTGFSDKGIRTTYNGIVQTHDNSHDSIGSSEVSEELLIGIRDGLSV